TALAWFLMRDFTASIKNLSEREQTQLNEKNQLQAQLEELEQKLADLKVISDEKQQHLSSSQKALNEKLFIINRFENEHKSRIEKLNYLNEKKSQIQKQSENEGNQVIQLQQQIEQLNNDKAEEELKLKTLDEEVQKLKAEVDAARVQYDQSVDELRQLNLHVLQVRQSVNDHETFIAVRQARVTSINEQAVRLKEQIEKDRATLQHIDSELKDLLQKRESSEKEAHDKKQWRLQLEEDIRKYEQQVHELRDKLSDERRNYEVKNNEYQLTKNLVEKMEGFPESIKYLKKNNQSFKDTPLLSDIINCDEKYKVSIENYLEPFLNHFIVERTDDAWKGLDLLHSEGKGRAHFFILDSLQKFNHSSPHEIEGCIPAINVVEPHHTYQ